MICKKTCVKKSILQNDFSLLLDMRLFLWSILLALYSFVPVSADDAEYPALPGQSVYMEQGIEAGMAIGNWQHLSCNTLVQADVHVAYHYFENWSGAADFRFYGGHSSDNTLITATRYYIRARYYPYYSQKMVWFMSPVLSLESINLTELQGDIENWGEESTLGNESCNVSSEGGVGAGGVAGYGYRWHPLWTWIGQAGMGGYSNGDWVLSLMQGASLNIRPLWGRMQRLTKRAELSFELTGDVYPLDGNIQWGWQLGFALGL
jgi:hypothetical protein